MRLDKGTIKMFEYDQKHWGTEVALYNIIHTLATDILHGIGVTSVRTSVKKGSGRTFASKFKED